VSLEINGTFIQLTMSYLEKLSSNARLNRRCFAAAAKKSGGSSINVMYITADHMHMQAENCKKTKKKHFSTTNDSMNSDRGWKCLCVSSNGNLASIQRLERHM
jgi:hypothetical protein